MYKMLLHHHDNVGVLLPSISDRISLTNIRFLLFVWKEINWLLVFHNTFFSSSFNRFCNSSKVLGRLIFRQSNSLTSNLQF